MASRTHERKALPDQPNVPGGRWYKFQRKYAPYIFISPFFILFAIFGIFPTIFSIYLSFQSWNPVQGLGSMEYVGLENYTYLLTDPWFWKSLYNTVWLALVSGLPQHLIAIPLAFALVSAARRLRHPLTAAYFLPYITSTVAVAIVFSTIFGTQFGVLNQLVSYLSEAPLTAWLFTGIREQLPVDWLGRAPFIKPAIAILVIWKYFGFNVVLYSAGVSTIPQEYYEAAEVDGANTLQRFWHITLPLLRPMIFFAVTLTIIGNLQLFDEPFILTGGTGGPSQAGMTVAVYLYRTGFEWLYMGSAAAMSWILFFLIGVLTVIHFVFFGRSGLERREG
ncbi:MAG: sugar ABC transporter permease [Trueperaceae bacterium]|nr:sugar ABC transporter permease [Trueperaceae bacterium]